MSTTTTPMIPVAKPVMDDAEVQAAGRAIRSGWVTQGPEVAALEREFGAFVGAPTRVPSRAARQPCTWPCSWPGCVPATR